MYTASTGPLNICSSVQVVAPPKCAAKASATSRLRVHTEVSFAPVTCLSPAAKRLAESPPPITPHVTTPDIPAPIRRLFSGTFVFCTNAVRTRPIQSNLLQRCFRKTVVQKVPSEVSREDSVPREKGELEAAK